MLSRSAEYAIAALIFLAKQPPGELRGAQEIAAETEIPLPYLWKILKQLTASKLVRSFKGVKGGYELARASRRITVRHVLAAVAHQVPLSACILNSSACDEKRPCPLHKDWTTFCEGLDRTTLADLSR
jgi:Rrf2 family protein